MGSEMCIRDSSYSFHNLDLKTGLKWIPFTAGPASPYVTAGPGVNSTVVRVEDHISDPWLNKKTGGLFLANAVRQHFSFDWMVAVGAEARIGPAFLIFAEYVHDRPFTNHFVEGYKYDTRTDAVVVGTGWRFL